MEHYQIPPFFTKPSSTFSMAFPKVLEGFAARKVLGCVLECGEGETIRAFGVTHWWQASICSRCASDV